ncbi:MAG: proprotein convertase P-domain-containing protein [Planctomycetaceae bacterium]|nr:proprotein convertase P-domain-containing protein [Planctomycetaceae bacterium]
MSRFIRCILISAISLTSIVAFCDNLVAKVRVESAIPDDPQPLLPDLFPWADESRGFLHDWVVEGDLLRFTTAFANNGTGHLELRGGEVLPNGNQKVFQRIFYNDGTFQDRLAGEFTYHSGHGHIHFDGYAVYSLRKYLPGGGIGDLVATGGKISFCLIDITKYRSNAGASRYNSCGQIQGVTAGWSDVYTRSLPDQWINISLVPDGQYWLEVTIDPDNLLLESDKSNNTSRIPVIINRGGSTGGDRWETNNTFATATNFGRTSEFHEVGLSIHDSGDEDYFRVVADEHGDFDIHVNFTHELGNLDLMIYDSEQNLIGSGNSQTDNEEVHFHGHEGEAYYIVIRGVEGATNGYELDVHGPGNLITQVIKSTDVPVVIPDGTSANTPGAWATSTLLGPEVQLTDINLIVERLDHSWLGDLEMELISARGTVAKILTSEWQTGGGLLGSQDNFRNTRMDDQATLNLAQGTAPYTGWFRINHANTGSNPLSVFNGENADGNWRLRIRDRYPADTGTLHSWCLMLTGVNLNPGDRFEPNNAHPQAVDLGVLGTATVHDVSIHNARDRDFYRFVAGVAGPAQIGINFLHASGNLDMIVYDSSLQEVGRADSMTDNEWLEINARAEELYYVEVFGVQEARNNYSLHVDVAVQVGETGTIAGVTDQWTTVMLDRTYVNPVVIAGPPTKHDPQPGVVEIRNVQAGQFDIRVANWVRRSLPRQGEVIDYLVVEEGRHELPDGQWLEAGVESLVAHDPRIVAFEPVGGSPMVLTQVLANDRGVASNARFEKIGVDYFSVFLQEPESSRGLARAKTLHWLIVGASSSRSSHFKHWSGLGYTDSTGATHSFGENLNGIPRVFAGVQSLNEIDPIGLRVLDIKSSKVELVLQEEQTNDKETNHDREIIAWMATMGGKIFDVRE